ncbi:MAG: Mu transposase C-terminal domain-containing protein, partial [Gammaproteobacteria bacterium]
MHVERGFKPVVPDEKVMDFLLMPGRTVTVHKWGIEMFGTADRRNLYQDDIFPERQLIGEKVTAKYDPDDLGTLYIYHKNQFIGAVRQERRRGYRETDLRDVYHRRKLARQAVQNTMKEQLARAQYGDDLERAKAERIHGEMEAQDLRAIAAGASRGSITALLPKHAQAARKLSLVTSQNEETRSVPTREERRQARLERSRNDGLKSLDELFPAEEWSEDAEPIVRKCHTCGMEESTEQKLERCLDCFYNPDVRCKQCAARNGCQYCDDCNATHTHRSKSAIELETGDGLVAALTYREHLKSEHPDWFWLDFKECANCGQELRTLENQRPCWECGQVRCGNCPSDHKCKKLAGNSDENVLDR